MSGGTYDYAQHHLDDIADEMELLAQPGRVDAWSNDPLPQQLPLTAAVVVPVLRELRKVVKEMDWHCAGDTTRDDETFAPAVKARLLRALEVDR